MTKAQREKAERLALKGIIDNHPEWKKLVDTLIDNPKVEIKNAIEPVIKAQLEDARMTGILIGWQTFALRAIANIEHMSTIEEVKNYFQSEADKMEKKLQNNNTMEENEEKNE